MRIDSDSRTRQDGFALLITALVLSLVSLLAFTAIRHSEQESTSGGRSRSSTRALHAADAGIQLALIQLRESPPDLTEINETLNPTGAVLQSRARTEASPQTLGQVGLGAPAEGYGLSVGSGVSLVNRLYLVEVTAEYGESTSEVDAKLSRMAADATGY